MRRRLFLGLLPVAGGRALAQDAGPLTPAETARVNQAAAKDPLLQAVIEELVRLRQLRTSLPALYFAEVCIDDAETFSVAATLGSAFAPQRAKLRPLRSMVRVGSPAFDNTGSVFSDYFSGTRFDSESLPLEGNVLALRHQLWLALDRSYKTAREALGRKSAAVRGVTQAEATTDFWATKPFVILEEARRAKVDEPAWSVRARALSAIFQAYPEISYSTVEMEASQGVFYYLNTELTAVRVNDRVASVRVRAAMQAPDGMPLYDGAQALTLDPDQLPSDSVLRPMVESVAGNLRALGAAPLAKDPYSGPVLFEAGAAAQIFGEVFAHHLGPVRRPVSEPGRAVPIVTSELESRLNSRVLPEWMDVEDDPTQEKLAGRPLAGYYKCDLDGVAPQPLRLVERGVLKQLLTTRQPARGMTGPNGRARLPGLFGVKLARIGNLIVKASQTQTGAQLRARLLEMVRQQAKPFGYVVRKMDFPSSGSIEDLRRIQGRAARSGGQGRPVSSPVLVYRLHADGREELVRGLRFRSLTTRAFRDIVAAGDTPAQFDYLDNGAPLALMGAGSYVVGCTVVAPALLFEDLELEPLEEDLPKLPIVPPPPVVPG
jgi:hypothetical protein